MLAHVCWHLLRAFGHVPRQSVEAPLVQNGRRRPACRVMESRQRGQLIIILQLLLLLQFPGLLRVLLSHGTRPRRQDGREHVLHSVQAQALDGQRHGELERIHHLDACLGRQTLLQATANGQRLKTRSCLVSCLLSHTRQHQTPCQQARQAPYHARRHASARHALAHHRPPRCARQNEAVQQQCGAAHAACRAALGCARCLARA